MVFSSLTFLFIFLPLTMLLYFSVPKKHIKIKNVVLLVLNLIFYAFGEPKNCIVMIMSIIVNYAIGLAIDKCEYRGKAAKFWVFAAVVLNIGTLVYYKYTIFICNNIYNIFKIGFDVKEIIKPIGISFFTFQGLSYVIDVYRKDTGCQKSLMNLALYISLFPQLIAGPIVRYETIADEITERESTLEGVALGIRRFMAGFAKKVILANTIGMVADAFFNSPASSLSVAGAWLAPFAYALQIYFDFSAYSDMAIGLGQIFGFHFLENFNYPYVSQSITDFWRRWHISLGTWFRDYVYIPLGGNRCSKIVNMRNILIVWLLTGIWHGAAWKFFAWGFYFAIILLLEKTFLLKVLKKLPRVFRHVYAIVLIVVGWAIFQSTNINYLIDWAKTVLFIDAKPLIDGKTLHYLTQYKVEFIICIIGSLPLAQLFKGRKAEILKYILTSVVFLIGIVYLLSNSFNPFIYFRF